MNWKLSKNVKKKSVIVPPNISAVLTLEFCWFFCWLSLLGIIELTTCTMLCFAFFCLESESWLGPRDKREMCSHKSFLQQGSWESNNSERGPVIANWQWETWITPDFHQDNILQEMSLNYIKNFYEGCVSIKKGISILRNA